MITNFNYDQAVRQAGKIEEIAADMKTLAENKLGPAYEGVDAVWDGEASGAFMGHCHETGRRVLARANELYETARRIREVARILREAEERARREMEELSRRAAAAQTLKG
jgi:glycerol kinase